MHCCRGTQPWIIAGFVTLLFHVHGKQTSCSHFSGQEIKPLLNFAMKFMSWISGAYVCWVFVKYLNALGIWPQESKGVGLLSSPNSMWWRDSVICALRAQSAVNQTCSVASHTSAKGMACETCSTCSIIAPQVEFDLLEGMQQQNTSWTRHQLVSIAFKEIVQLNLIAKKLCS